MKNSLENSHIIVQLDEKKSVAIAFDAVRDELVCVAYPTDENGKSIFTKRASFQIQTLGGNAIKLQVKTDIVPFQDNQTFEDIEVDGIGNLTLFNQLTVKQLITRLEKTDKYALYVVNAESLPNNWPKEVVKLKKKSKKTLIHWYLNLDGKKWLPFPEAFLTAQFNLEFYSSMGLAPAIMYEKKILTNKHVSYLPLVHLLVTDRGEIKMANKSSCMEIINQVLSA